MKNKVELLAPAGDFDAFKAAVENGADAVYAGGKLFNARQFASNFDEEQLEKAIDYAHVKGVKVFLTMNTLMSDRELDEALELAKEAYVAGIDGIIVQDLGFAGLLRSLYPDLKLHASTQMTIHNLDGVKMLENLGFKRVVLARELSVEEIKHICENTHLEVEVFVHGALCVCYSGQCLMSSIIGGRSGNRGKCAQPCRLPYEIMGDDQKLKQTDHKGYLLSPKDISGINLLPEIVKAGVSSLKIEGRMKSAEYVATVVRIYRKYLDQIEKSALYDTDRKYFVQSQDINDLTQIFNRGGFSEGYFKGKTGADMMSYEKPKNWGVYIGRVKDYNPQKGLVKVALEGEIAIGDGIEIWSGEGESPGTVVSEILLNNNKVKNAYKGQTVTITNIKGRVQKESRVYKTSSRELNERARQSFEKDNLRKVHLTGEIIIKGDKPVTIRVKDSEGNEAEVISEYIPEKAISRPLTVERVTEQLNKTGATPFAFDKTQVQLDESLSVPISVINDIRRRALERIEALRIEAYKRHVSKNIDEIKDGLLHFPGNSRIIKTDEIKVSLFFYKASENFSRDYTDADRIYLPFASMLSGNVRETAKFYEEKGCEVFVWLPSIIRGNYEKLIKSKIDEVASLGIHGFLVGNIGGMNYLKKFTGLKLLVDYSANVFNSFTMKELKDMGFDGCTLSPELNLKQISVLWCLQNYEMEVLVYGRIPLMVSEYCPVGSVLGGFGKNQKCSQACDRGVYRLKDRKGVEFPVICDKIDCRSTILNSNVLYVGDSMDEIRESGIDVIRLNISDEKPNEVARILKMHKDIAKNGLKQLEKYRDIVNGIQSKGFTKGHFYRGV